MKKGKNLTNHKDLAIHMILSSLFYLIFFLPLMFSPIMKIADIIQHISGCGDIPCNILPFVLIQIVIILFFGFFTKFLNQKYPYTQKLKIQLVMLFLFLLASFPFIYGILMHLLESTIHYSQLGYEGGLIIVFLYLAITLPLTGLLLSFIFYQLQNSNIKNESRKH